MPKLEVKNVSVSAGEKETVKDVSFTIESGEVHILMGANGSGKSSLINALFGHPKYKLTAGNIILDGEDITDLLPHKKARAGLFLSLQHLPEIDGVTFMNFLYRAYKDLTGKEMSIMDFHKFLSEKTKAFGLSDGFLRRSVNVGLSGGEKKQSEIFQLALFEPKFAFLDEIDSGVDVDSLGRIFKAIGELKEKGVGFLLITHYPKILDRITPDKVHVMDGGKIVRSGGPELAAQISEKGFQNILA